VANVFDVNGNTVQNVPVIFSAESSSGDPNTPAPPLTEFRAGGGAPRFTDANGQAFDTLRTRAPAPGAAGLSKTVVVKATPAKGESGTVTVTIFYSTGR
jgi:hypothetical protein